LFIGTPNKACVLPQLVRLVLFLLGEKQHGISVYKVVKLVFGT